MLLDANVLLHAYHPGLPSHARARAWLEEALSGSRPLRLAWSVIHAFIRISTDARVFSRPFAIEEATGDVKKWLETPCVSVLGPGDLYWPLFVQLVHEHGLRGPDVMDAHLAALAIENGATLCTADRGFLRFRNLKLLNPLRD